ncbi:hypothetical protein ACFSE1_01770 [Rhizobium helianthi]|uniref:Uncharacterized protein n=1 Tax=Rhizobium helianthi TaxID=1132695 RepID=A0ABW4LZJ0_9HYPH
MTDNYSFAADLLATFRASPDVIKALWLIIPPGFVLCVLRLLLRWREGRRGLRLRRGRYFRQPVAEGFGSLRREGARQDLLSHEELSGIGATKPSQIILSPPE